MPTDAIRTAQIIDKVEVFFGTALARPDCKTVRAKAMQVSSSTSASSTQALLPAAQLSDLSSSLFGSLSIKTTGAAQLTATTSPAPTSNLLSPSLAQALINSTQVDGGGSSTSNSETGVPSIQSTQAASNQICIFQPLPGMVARDASGNIIQPLNLSPNVTPNDIAVLKAAFGFTPDTEPTDGQPINSEAWNAYQKMLGEISYARGQYAQGDAVIQGNLTASEFTKLATESATVYQLPLTATQLQNGLNAIENGIPDSASSSSPQNQAS